MEGFLHLRIAPWLRRLITRLIALVPAVLVIVLAGEQSTQQLLVLSQVILSLQLSFAVISLIHFTSNRRNMGSFANPWWVGVLAWGVAGVIVALNGKLVVDQVLSWIELAGKSGLRLGPVPLSWLVGTGLLAVTGSIAALLFWVTIKPLVRPSPAWAPPVSVALDWVEALRPRPLSRIGVALEHDRADAEILNRALGLAQVDRGHPELLLLHVVDTPVTRVHGADTADRETGADARYLSELVQTLRERGFRARSILLHGPDPAGQLVGYLRSDPVDLLVVGSHGHGLVRDLLFGQTVDRVRHHIEIPMLIARPGRGSTPIPGATSSPSLSAPSKEGPLRSSESPKSKDGIAV